MAKQQKIPYPVPPKVKSHRVTKEEVPDLISNLVANEADRNLPQNMEVEIVDGQLMITGDATKRIRPSKTGRTQIVATTNGLKTYKIDGKTYFVALSVSVQE